MNSKTQIPRIHTSGETSLICANRAGFIELHNKITSLLKNEEVEISLETSDPYDISTLCLDNSIDEPEAQSFITTALIFTILIIVLVSTLVGIGTIASWLLS